MHGSSTLDYDAVPASLADAAVKPADPAYGRSTSSRRQVAHEVAQAGAEDGAGFHRTGIEAGMPGISVAQSGAGGQVEYVDHLGAEHTGELRVATDGVLSADAACLCAVVPSDR